MKLSKFVKFMTVGMMVLSLVLAGCSQSSAPAPEKKAAELVVGQAANPTTMDPHDTQDTLAYSIQRTMYEGLLSFDKDMKVIPVLAEAGRPVLIGASRKGFIGRVLGCGPDDRRAGSLAVAVFSIQRGAHVLRVHDVKESCDAAKLMDKLRAQGTQDGLVT